MAEKLFVFPVELFRTKARFNVSDLSDDECRDLIEEALDFIDSQCRAWRKRFENGVLSQRSIQRIILEVLQRVEMGSDGLRSEREGDYSYDRNPVTAGGDWWLSDRNLKALGCGPVRKKIGTVNVNVDAGYGVRDWNS